jgi:hypothetical protein
MRGVPQVEGARSGSAEGICPEGPGVRNGRGELQDLIDELLGQIDDELLGQMDDELLGQMDSSVLNIF